MDDPLLLPMFLVILFLYMLGVVGTAFMFEHMDSIYGYNPSGMLKALRSLFWFSSVMLVGLVVMLSGTSRSKGEYYE